jgi:hypothetical protein
VVLDLAAGDGVVLYLGRADAVAGELGPGLGAAAEGDDEPDTQQRDAEG